MTSSENKYFEILKVKIVETMQQSHPEIPNSVSDWKGQHIFDFQEDLQFKQNENISEKWFYTHMKSANSKLPRIDILNILSKYAGYKSWDEFKLKNKDSENEIAPDKSNRVFYLAPLFLLIALLIIYLIVESMYTQVYTFCFYDSDTKKPVENSMVEITVLSDDESPVNYLCNNNGCFTIKTSERTIRFLVETPYYHTDTIVRTLNKFNRTENIKLKIDDYAVMIHYFSSGNVKDWEKRRDDLDQMLSDSAKIFQVLNHSGTVGMEIYNKWEFINKLSLPSSSLRDIEVIDKKYEGEKICRLRFKQNETNQ
jgi:hypothetical protein